MGGRVAAQSSLTRPLGFVGFFYPLPHLILQGPGGGLMVPCFLPGSSPTSPPPMSQLQFFSQQSKRRPPLNLILPSPHPALQKHRFLFIRPEAFTLLGPGTDGAWIRSPGLASVHSCPVSRQLHLLVPGCACHLPSMAGRLPVPTQPCGHGS